MTAARMMAPVAVAVWLAIVATGFALAAMAAMEPPVWDALSYVLKAYSFWQAVDTGKLFDPFALPMTVRPPGTILMSYPFGWSDNFHWFYFRSLFFPVVLLIAAVYIAGWSRHLTRAGHWMLASLALVLAGMPILYQFQVNTDLPMAAAWGLVDGFLAGVCAVAAAAAVRSVAERSTAWSIVAAVAGGLGLWIKPYGLALMVLVGASWLLLVGSSLGWRLTDLRHDAALRRFVSVSLVTALACFAVAVGLAFRSDYFSLDNIIFGRRVLTILEGEFSTPITVDMLVATMRVSFGFTVPVVALAGLVATVRSRAGAGSAIAAVLCALVGIWLYEPGQVRYSLPFGTMAFILLLPALMKWLQTLKPVAALAGVGAAVVPTLVITALLLAPRAPDAWQRALGISLHVNDFQAENEQAAAFLDQLRTEGKDFATVYFSDTTPALRNLVAVWDNSNVTWQDAPRVTALLPLDWQRATTIHVDDLLGSDAIAVEFVRDEKARAAILAERRIPNHPALARLFNAWASGLSEADGITVVSETRVRLARIVDRSKFDAALARLEADYDMPQAYRDANPQRWWSAAELAARQPAPAATITFHRITDPTKTLSLHVADVTQDSSGLQAAFWIEQPAPGVLEGKWYLFGHLLDDAGKMVANVQVDVFADAAPTAERTIRSYRLFYPNRPPKAVTLAFGLYKPSEPEPDLGFFIADQGTRDWEGRRVIVPLPSIQ
jgi:hypothetical protein